MARIQVFQGGSVQREAPQVTPFRAPDFGPGIGPGIEKLGQGLGEAASAVDQIEDIHARVEANKFSIAHNNLATTISERVRSTLGDGAQAAADKGYADLKTGTDTILSQASPRARKILETEFAKRNTEYQQQWWEHGFDQTKQAFDTSSQAANDKDLEAALHQSTDQAAAPYLESIRSRNRQRSSFFGLGSAWEDGENRKAVSTYHRGRAETTGATSAYAAVRYAIDHRGDMTDQDFNAILHSYDREALHERGVSMYYGTPLGDDPTITAPPPGTETAPITTKTTDPKRVFNALIIPNEGSALVHDSGNGALVKYGINQKENPDVDVANLTAAGAQKLFIDRYWKPSGADKMAPALAVVHADTYYLAPKEAAKILRESKGDVQKYMELRTGYLAALHAKDPSRWPDYTKRNERVERFAAQAGGNGQAFSFHGKVGPDSPMAPMISEIMSRKDMPLALKTELIDIAREDRNAQREDRTIKRDDARDDLITASTQLGDKFTSIKQLPAEALANASPEVIASLTAHAKTNRDKKSDEKLRPLAMNIELTDPKRFMSKDFVPQLMKQGATPALVRMVQTQQENITRKQMNAKPDVVSDGSLWGVAKDAFKAAGIGVHQGPQSVKIKQQDAAVHQQAVTYLRTEATEWANDHPDEKPTSEIMSQWVGAALLKTKAGAYSFQATNEDIYNSIPDSVRNAIIRDIKRRDPGSRGSELISDVASVYRKLRANYGTGPITLTDHGIRESQLSGTPVGGFNETLGDVPDALDAPVVEDGADDQ